ncbi:uncharacterized protein LOC143033438 isoform X2 [Oratosquilla oratoria]
MPVAAITLISGDWKFSPGFCYLNGFAVGLGLMVSVHTLMWISIHKYISITRPFSRAITRRRIGYMIAACWIWAVMYNLTPIMGLTEMVYKRGASQCGPIVPETLLQKIHSYANTFFNLILPISVMSYCYYNVFAEVKRHLVRMRDSSNLDFRNTVLQQQKISLTLFIVLACFIICWIPYIFYSMFLVIGGKNKVNIIFNPIAYLFGYMNSACNPIIYAFRSPSFRSGYKDILCCRKRVPGARKFKNWNTPNRHNPSDILGTFRERRHPYGNRVVIGPEHEETPRTKNLKYKKVVLDREGTPQGLAMTSSAPKYDMGIAMTKNTLDQEEFFRRSNRQRAVEQAAYSEGCIYAYTTHQKTCLHSPLRTRHQSEQTGKQRRIPDIQLTLTGNENQRPAFLCPPVNHARDMDEVIPNSPTTPKKSLIQNFASDVLEENICLFAEPLEELERDGVDMNILGKHLLSSKKNPDEIRSWSSEALLDTEKGRSEDTLDMTSVSASNPNLTEYLGGGDDNKAEQIGSAPFLGVEGSKVRCNSYQEVLCVHSDSNLVGPKKTISADDIDTGQNMEGNVRPMPFRDRGYTDGGTRWNNRKTSRHHLMWQASVEGLTGSPLDSKSKRHCQMSKQKTCHVRQVDIGQFSKEEQGRGPKKANEGNFLGFASLLTTVRRSFSDFFLVEPTSDNEDKKKSPNVIPNSCATVI